MPALSRGQENTQGILNWFITVNGVLTDANLVQYRILDISAGLPGVQVFPLTAAPSYEVVTAAPGRFNAGSYYCYDNGNAQGFTPELTATVGTHRVEWQWQISPTAPIQSGCEDFEVLVQSAGSSADLYITIQDVRDAGLTDTVAHTDADVLAAIEIWQAFLDRACRQWFNAKSMVLELDGTDSDALHFGVPIISVSYMQINNSGQDLDATRFKVYSAVRYPDDRRNPRIKLVNSDADVSIYSAPLSTRSLRFRKGRQNQIVKGVFGYVEEDGQTPRLIKRALTKLVIEKLTSPIYVPSGSTAPVPPPPIVGNLLEEWTDGHKRKYAPAGGEKMPRRAGLSGITDDPEILDIIKLYMAPLGMAAPAHPSIS